MRKPRYALFFLSWTALSTVALAGPRFSFAFRAGSLLPSAASFNGDVVGAYNDGLAASADMLSSMGLTTTLSEMAKIAGAADWGGEVEMFLGPVLSVVAGGGYWRETRSAALHGEGDFMGSALAYDEGVTAKFSLLSLYASVRANLYALEGRLRFYAGAGIGYYWCPTSTTTTMKIDVDGSSDVDSPYETDARGSALLPHLNVGADVRLLGPLSAGIDIRYALGKIATFKITGSTDGAGVGEQFYYSDTAGNTKPFVFELNGFNIGLMLKLRL